MFAASLGFEAARAFEIVPGGPGYGLGCALVAAVLLIWSIIRIRK